MSAGWAEIVVLGVVYATVGVTGVVIVVSMFSKRRKDDDGAPPPAS